MNGIIYKQKVEELFKEARNKYPDITDDMIENKIYYQNGNDGTDFDWGWNNHLCEFVIFYLDGRGFIKVVIDEGGKVDVFIYDPGQFLPSVEYSRTLALDTEDMAALMMHIADEKHLFDCGIDELNWDAEASSLPRIIIPD